MVFISAAIGAALTILVQRTTTVSEILYCSSLNSSTSNNVPIQNTTDSRIKTYGANVIFGSTTNSILAVNYFQLSASLIGFSAGGAGTKYPCVFWFQKNYPTSNSSLGPYESPNNISSALLPLYKMDSTYIPQPFNGWIGILASNSSNPDSQLESQLFQTYQQRSWYVYSTSSSVPQSLVGSLQQGSLLNLQQAALSSSLVSYNNATASNGILDTFETRFYVELAVDEVSAAVSISGVQRVPYFVATADLTTDAALTKYIEKCIPELAKVDKTALLRGRNAKNLLIYNAGVNAVLKDVPFGGFTIDQLDFANGKFNFTYQIGRDIRIQSSSSFPLPGIRQMQLQTQLSNAIFRKSNTSFAGATITQGFRAFPQLTSTELNFPAAGLIGSILFPFAVSFLLPIFTVALVVEKVFQN